MDGSAKVLSPLIAAIATLTLSVGELFLRGHLLIVCSLLRCCSRHHGGSLSLNWVFKFSGSHLLLEDLLSLFYFWRLLTKLTYHRYTLKSQNV